MFAMVMSLPLRARLLADAAPEVISEATKETKVDEAPLDFGAQPQEVIEDEKNKAESQLVSPAEDTNVAPPADEKKVEDSHDVEESHVEPAKKSKVGLYILVGVAVLGTLAIATTFVLGKQKN